MSIADEIAKRQSEQAAAKTDTAASSAIQQGGIYIPSTAADQRTENANRALEAAATGAQSKTNIMDPAATIKGTPVVNVKQDLPRQALIQGDQVAAAQEASEIRSEFRTFKHIYAGAKTHMADGKEIRFGGLAGSPGFYATRKEDEIKFLSDLANLPASQITEVTDKGAPDHTGEFFEDLSDAHRLARRNTDQFYDPNVTKAVDGLGNAIMTAGRKED